MNDNLKQRALSAGLWYGGSRWAIQGLTWMITIFVARILTPSDYGLFGFALLVAGIVDLINELGLGAAIVQQKNLTEEILETVFWFALAISLLVYAGVWLTAPWIAAFFRQPGLVPVLRVSTLSFPLGSLRIIPWNLFTKQVDFKRRSLVEIAANITAALLTLRLASVGFGVWALVWGGLCKQTVTTILCLWLQPWWPRGRFSFTGLRSLYRFGLNVSASNATWYLYSNADFMIVGKLLGQQMLGLYTMVFQLATLPLDRIMSVINQVAFPVYAQLQTQPERRTKYFLKLATLVTTIIFPVVVGAFLVVDVAIPLLLTAKWAPIVVPLRILCWIGIPMSLGVLVNPAILALGRPDLFLRFNLISLLVLPVGFLVGTRFGIEGVCWAWLVLYPPLNIAWYLATRKLVGFEWKAFFRALEPATVCTLVMLACGSFARWATSSMPISVTRLLVLIGTGSLTYLGMLFLRYRAELGEFRQLLRKAPQNIQPAAMMT